MAAIPLDDQARSHLATQVVAAASREYPHMLIQELNSDADVVPPRVLNPSFFGSYDWHSAVHSHWTLVRCVTAGLPGDVAETVINVLDEHLSETRLAGELTFYAGPGGRVAERPYGWAWLVMLHAECRRLAGSSANPSLAAAGERWATALGPLNTLLRGRLVDYFSAGLAFALRAGTHGNTAYSLQLLHQAAGAAGDEELASAVLAAGRYWFEGDDSLPWFVPPSGSDFLDPSLVEAAFMADVLAPDEYRAWMARLCPAGIVPDWSPARFIPDGADPYTVHLEGLHVSRAWCLDRVGRALEPGSPLATAALAGRDDHLQVVAKIDPFDGFNRAHWLPTYLVYLEGWLANSL
jgi:Protein of unknown function (DUF2891)